MMKQVFAASLSLFFVMSLASADTLLLDGIESARDTANLRPTRGMSMDAVRSAFGSPSAQHDAVGPYPQCTEERFCPPIMRWDYSSFVVYFERQYVIHAVATR